MMGIRKRTIILGLALLIIAAIAVVYQRAGATLNKDSSLISDAVQGQSETMVSQPKAPKHATQSALTAATEYKPATSGPSACTSEYESLAMLATEEIKNRILDQEAELSEACKQAIVSEVIPGELDEIQKACRADLQGPTCTTLVINLRSRLMEVVTQNTDPESLPTNIILNKIYSRSISNHGPEDIRKTLDLISELESRGENLGFTQQRLSLMSRLVDQDRSYWEEFEALAEKSEVEFPEDVLPYRFKNSMISEDLRAADLVIKEHLRKHANSAQAHYLMAILEYKRGNIEGAQALATRSLELDPSNVYIQEEVQSFRDDPKNWKAYYRLPSVNYRF